MAGVFVLRDDRSLVALAPAQFARESDFQELLAAFPALLAGDQMDVAEPRRFLLVKREQGVADELGGGHRWSLDHLFLDQEGVPTLVEVKRQSDTRLRREVIGQMLDYAANGVGHWSMEEMRAGFAARCREAGLDPALILQAHIGEAADPEAYWSTVRTNLQAGRIRMLFVADLIPPEVRKVVEFLNRQMRPAEVLAVELRQYAGEGLKALAPIVIGQSQEVLERKAGAGRRGNVDTLLEALADDPPALAAATAIFDWCRTHADRLQLTSSGKAGPVFVQQGGAPLYPFLIDGDGGLTLYFDLLSARAPFDDPARLQAFVDELVRSGVAPASALQGRRPTLALGEFSPEMTDGFLRAMAGFTRTLDERSEGLAPTMA